MIRIPLYIQYDDKKMTDGFGAQGTRVIGIFAIAKFFRLKYIHQGISEISNRYELLGANSSQSKYEKVLSALNSYISPNKDEIWAAPRNAIEVYVYNIGFRSLFIYSLKSLLKPNRYLLKVCLPFGITDRVPSIYVNAIKSLKIRSKYGGSQIDSRPLVLHIRTGEHSPAFPRTQLGPDYYAKIIFSDKYGSLTRDKWIIHTDFKVTDFDSSSKSQRAIGFCDLFSKLENKKNIELNHYADIESVFEDMVNSRVLVVSRSALSYLAALLCEGLIVFPSNHGHSALPNWVVESTS